MLPAFTVTPEGIRTVHTHYSDRPGSSQTVAVDQWDLDRFVETFELHGMTSGYGEFYLAVYRLLLPPREQWRTEGRVVARIEWADGQQDFALQWAKRRPKFPELVHTAVCYLFPFMKEF